jgi:hypothetical protein
MRGFGIHQILSNPLKFSSLKKLYYGREFLIEQKTHYYGRNLWGYPRIISSKLVVVNKLSRFFWDTG